jgi:pyruvate/2-oxoglutarate dehydrogenase complex dihydrolipoamide acyltransferase (E2) component
MFYEFSLPQISPQMPEAVIECLYPVAGAALKSGDKLLDLSVDLSSSFAQDCPPISYFRIIMRENVVLREFHVSRGQACKVGELIAVFSTVADEPKDRPAQRGIRFATAGILQHSGMWTVNDSR